MRAPALCFCLTSAPETPTLRAMHRSLWIVLFICASAHAAPNDNPGDPLSQLLAEKDLLAQLSGHLDE